MATKSAGSREHARDDPLDERKIEVDRRIHSIREDVIHGKTAAAEVALDNLSSDFEDIIAGLKDQVQGPLGEALENIEKKPLVAVGTALALGLMGGLVIGALLSRKSEDVED